jgi:hypothetical protein
MDYNSKENLRKAILIKQGFTNYEYTIAVTVRAYDYENAIDGNFYQTK